MSYTQSSSEGWIVVGSLSSVDSKGEQPDHANIADYHAMLVSGVSRQVLDDLSQCAVNESALTV